MARTHTRGGGGCRVADTPPKSKLKKTDFVYKKILDVLHDLIFSRNLPLKSSGLVRIEHWNSEKYSKLSLRYT
jgi:hypothetical protein